MGPALLDANVLQAAEDALWEVRTARGTPNDLSALEQLAHEIGHILRLQPDADIAVDGDWTADEVNILCVKSSSIEWDELIVSAATARVMSAVTGNGPADELHWEAYCLESALGNINTDSRWGAGPWKDRYWVQLRGHRTKSAALAQRVYDCLAKVGAIVPDKDARHAPGV